MKEEGLAVAFAVRTGGGGIVVCVTRKCWLVSQSAQHPRVRACVHACVRACVRARASAMYARECAVADIAGSVSAGWGCLQTA